jgi:hypothetical protein
MLEYLPAPVQWTCGYYDAGVHYPLAAINNEVIYLTPRGGTTDAKSETTRPTLRLWLG